MKTQIFRIAALLLISLFYLTACQKDNPAGDGEFIQTPDFNDDMAPAWSPDGSAIAFTHRTVPGDTSGGPFGIYFINPDGTGRRLFLLGGHSPAWSPDGTKIAYSIGGTYILDLVQGGPPEKFLDNASFPDWSPDGKQLVFARFETPLSTRSIYKANLDGSGITQLVKPRDNEDEHRYPAYSHSDDRIAFSSLKKGIAIMDADGKNEKGIFKKLSAHPSWSPDDQLVEKGGERNGRLKQARETR